MELQTAAYETLITALRSLTLDQRRGFMVRVLTIALDLPGLSNMPSDCLIGLLFGTLDSADPRKLLDMQNVFIYVTHVLNGVWR